MGLSPSKVRQLLFRRFYGATLGVCDLHGSTYRSTKWLDTETSGRELQTPERDAMAKIDFGPHREQLLALRGRLHGDMTQMADGALNKDQSKTTSMPTDMAELGSANFDQELTLSLLGNEKGVLDQIQTALERIEDGSYGRCEDCGKAIPDARLEAIPYAALCVRCTSRREGQGHES
jgi:DnaK suppressor protein